MGRDDSYQTLREIVINKTDTITKQVEKIESHMEKIDNHAEIVNKALTDSYIFRSTHYENCPNTPICKQIKLIKWFIIFIGSVIGVFQGMQTFYPINPQKKEDVVITDRAALEEAIREGKSFKFRGVDIQKEYEENYQKGIKSMNK